MAKVSSKQTKQTVLLAHRTLWVACLQVLIAILTGGIGIFMAWKINHDAIAREKARGLERSKAIVNGIQWEMGIAEIECKAFIQKEHDIAKTFGSPVWIAQTTQIQNGLSNIFYDDLDATDALQRLLADLTGLNERNHLMANASVDNLSAPQKAWFLKNNLRLYKDNCAQVLDDVKSGRPIILAKAQGKGLGVKPIDAGGANSFPSGTHKMVLPIKH